WPNQNVVDVFREHEADCEHHAKRDQRLDQPRPQLDQMIHQGGFGGLDVLMSHVTPPACLGGGGSEAARSFSLTWGGASGSATLMSTCCCGSGKAAGVAGFSIGASPISGISNARSISFWVFAIGSNLVKSLTELFRSSACFFSSAISASRIAS